MFLDPMGDDVFNKTCKKLFFHKYGRVLLWFMCNLLCEGGRFGNKKAAGVPQLFKIRLFLKIRRCWVSVPGMLKMCAFSQFLLPSKGFFACPDYQRKRRDAGLPCFPPAQGRGGG